MRRNLLYLVMMACVPPEKGLDNTLITGQVRIAPVRVTEIDADNDGLQKAQALDDLYIATQIIEGTLSSFDEVAPDLDAYSIISRNDLPWQQVAITLSDATAIVEVELFSYDRIVDGRPLLLESVIVRGSDLLSFPAVIDSIDTGYYIPDSGIENIRQMIGGVQYGLLVTPISGAAGTSYTLAIPGKPPSETQLLVGAYPDSDAAARGLPIGGSTVEDWTGGTAAEEYVWTGSYEIYLLRTLTGEGLDIAAVEGAEAVWLFAGDWPSLNSPLASGTWYSSAPIPVRLPETEPGSYYPTDALRVEVEDPLMLDTFAEAIVVQEFTETEPNNLQPTWPPAVDLATAADANDASMLSGPGFADRFLGTIVYGPELYGYTHDSDAWRFTVPEPCRIIVTATWDDVSACLDIYIVDDVEGVGLDYAANFEQPEVGGGFYTYQPGTTYYLVMLGYAGEPEGASTAYDMLVEQLPP